MSEKFYYITTPIYYVNDKPHIGHAYTTLASDVLARFMRLDGYQVKFLTGTDEHGQKVEQAAKTAGMAPQDFVDKVSQNFRALGDILKFSNNDFIRTTEERHKKSATALWNKLVEKGDIYLGKYAGWYAVRDETFYLETDLKDGKAPTGADVEWVEEPSYFFRLSKWQDKLLAFYEEHPDFIAPTSRRNEVISFVKSGLRDLSVSRTSFKWGIPVPNDPDHIMYVWIEALSNYITAVGYPDELSDTFQKFWPCDLHMVGKDIVKFHAVYWPAFLMAAGLQPPKRIFAHGWWTNEGQKISKSLGNVIDPINLVETYGLDPVRYFLLREVPFGSDGDFSKTAIIQRLNSNLANDLGNLIQRTASMAYKNCEGMIPHFQEFTQEDLDLLYEASNALKSLRSLLQEQLFHKALDVLWTIIGNANRYIDHQAPWSLKKTDTQRMGTVLYVVLEVTRHLGLYLQAFMPDSATKILDLLGVPEDQRTFAYGGCDFSLKAGTQLQEPTPIFPRYVEN
ncbi:MAG: methionine--tRNA ligase [Alphaproteobacteria bacterium]|nr:methionine--tRNA ligase [Alphaproteobacteria bacterium]